MDISGEGASLAEFLAPGLIAEDIPPLFPLLAARPLIGALIALFRGGDEEVLIRLMVLREVGLRADAVMKSLADAGLDDDSWRLAQSIGQRQSRLLRMAPVFQRQLAGDVSHWL